jgi:soluble lytic murein transglycosylase-like protein
MHLTERQEDRPPRFGLWRRVGFVALGACVVGAEAASILLWPARSESAPPPPAAVPLRAGPSVPATAARSQSGVVSASVAYPGDTVREIFAALTRCRALIPESVRWRIAGTIADESSRYGYDPLFVLAMIEVESTCRPRARSSMGAIGLIQVKPSTARAVAKRVGMRWEGARMLERPSVNVRLGLRYLWDLERRFQDPQVALAAYNLGPTRVARMTPAHARRARYVRRVVSRYENLLAHREALRS